MVQVLSEVKSQLQTQQEVGRLIPRAVQGGELMGMQSLPQLQQQMNKISLLSH